MQQVIIQPMSQWDLLSDYLKEWGQLREIRAGRYTAYIGPTANILDIVEPDWWHGEERPHGLVPLPWKKHGPALKQKVLQQCFRHPTWPVVAP